MRLGILVGVLFIGVLLHMFFLDDSTDEVLGDGNYENEDFARFMDNLEKVTSKQLPKRGDED